MNFLDKILVNFQIEGIKKYSVLPINKYKYSSWLIKIMIKIREANNNDLRELGKVVLECSPKDFLDKKKSRFYVSRFICFLCYN